METRTKYMWSKEWLLGSSPNYKIVMEGRNLVFKNVTKKTLCRLRYLARREGLSYRGFIIKALMLGIKSHLKT